MRVRELITTCIRPKKKPQQSYSLQEKQNSRDFFFQIKVWWLRNKDYMCLLYRRLVLFYNTEVLIVS